MRSLPLYILILLLPLTLAGQDPDTLKTVKSVTVTPATQDTTAASRRGVQPAGTRPGVPPAGANQPGTNQPGTNQPGANPTGKIPPGAIPPGTGQPGTVSQGADSAFTTGSRQWTLSADFTTEIPVPLDTAFSLFNHYRTADKYSDFNAYTGNYGLPLYQINFFDREWKPDRFLYAHYLPFMFTPANTLFINTHVPFTELKWSNGGARSVAEQTFRVRHSQNVNRFLNFGLIYDIVYNIGQYNLQKAIDKNFLFHGSYNGNAYTAYFSTGINNHESEESGGMVDVNDLSLYEPEGIPFILNELNGAKSSLKNRYIMLVQRYAPGGKRDTVPGEVLKTGPTFNLSISFHSSSV